MDEIKQYCGCGWPEYLILPKGSIKGTKYQLFVMISDYNQDKVSTEQKLKKFTLNDNFLFRQVDQQESNGVCNDCFVFCGLRDRLYPDKRPMGFPFDCPAKNVTKLCDFYEHRPNMSCMPVCIRHLDEDTVY